MTKVAVVFFSGYGHTAKQAEAVERGARSVSGVDVTVLRINEQGELPEGGFECLAAQDAIIYGSPTYMGGPPWQFKKFADATSKLWVKQELKNTLAAGFTNSAAVNGDKLSTIQYQWILSQQHGQIWVGLGQLPANKKTSGPDDINWSGGFAGAMAISPSDASPEEAPRSGDLKTAELLGQRVSEIAARFRG
ncbi:MULTISPECIES: flavodoxin family protein [Dickeya]|uniref:flavodoxin family protein n=1 Tax=Dickeya TaxID=204037 RepID=UPI000532B89F|nr:MULTISPECIES: flavodoxin family protein [Dickeya]TYL43757.1 flavodoxin family protein [Dickeya sp. ws52]